ncbi:hypothetical protein Tco_0382203 [Tanacetum coccineum]
MLKNLEIRCIHEGLVVFLDFDDMVYVRSMFGHIGFKCLLKISEQIVPRFILEFYSQYRWSLEDLQYSVPTSGPYQTDLLAPDEIKNYVQEEQEGSVTRIHHDVVINVEENQILTREIVSVMKTWVEIIRENVLCLDGNRDHVPACLCHMLYFIARSKRYSLAYFIAKRMEFATKQPRLIIPYGMLLTRLFKYVMSESPELSNDRYVLYERVMYPLTAQQERKTRKDYGRRRGCSSTYSSFAFGQPSSSYLNDDDDDRNDERTSRVSTPPTPSSSNPSKKIKLTIIPPRQIFVDLTSKEDNTTTPSPITKSLSPSPPNAPSKNPSTKDTSSTFGTTSSYFESKPQSSPPSSNETLSPQPFNPFLDDIMDAPPRPSYLLPPQSHPSLDITLLLSPITPLDHILDTPSPPSPQPPPQAPLLGHPIYFNMFDYHGVNCLCCFHNRNLIFSLRDEMNLMFAHLEYLLTSVIASPSSPHP